MKKLLVCVLCGFLLACASTPIVKDSNEFETTNYQAKIDSMIASTDSLDDFSSNSTDEAKINITDLSLLMRGDVYFNQGDYINALPIYKQLAFQYKAPKIIYKAIICYERTGIQLDQINDANNLINLFIVQAPQTRIAKILQIKVSLFKGDLAVAKKDIDSLLAHSSIDDARKILLFLSATLSINVLADANNSMPPFASYVVSHYSNYPETYLLAATCYSISNNESQLKNTLSYIEANYPTWQIPLFWSVSILSNNANYKTIINVVKPILDTDPADNNLQNTYVAALMNNNQIDIAESYLITQVKTNKSILEQIQATGRRITTPCTMSTSGVIQQTCGLNMNEYNNALLNLGLIYAKEKQDTQSLSYLIQTQSSNITMQNMINMLIALIYDTQNNYQNATSYYSKVSGNVYLENVAEVLLVSDYNTLHDQVNLAKTIELVAKNKNLQGLDLVLFKAQTYTNLEDYQMALQVLKDNYNQYKKEKTFVYTYASTTALAGKSHEAIALYNTYIKMDPKSAFGYNDLAYVYTENTKNYKLALKYAKKAIQISPLDPNVLDTLGWVYYKIGDYNNAYAYINSSYQLNQTNDAAKHLRATLIALKKPELANKIVLVNKYKLNSDIKVLLEDKMLNLLMLLQYGVKIN